MIHDLVMMLANSCVSCRVTVERDEKIHNAIIVTVLKEDHTFGNLLRMHLLRHPTVLFAGYKMPHPLEHKVVLSVRTTHDNPVSIVQEALGELYNMCDHLTENF